jgi:hypothetical protein
MARSTKVAYRILVWLILFNSLAELCTVLADMELPPAYVVVSFVAFCLWWALEWSLVLNLSLTALLLRNFEVYFLMLQGFLAGACFLIVCGDVRGLAISFFIMICAGAAFNDAIWVTRSSIFIFILIGSVVSLGLSTLAFLELGVFAVRKTLSIPFIPTSFDVRTIFATVCMNIFCLSLKMLFLFFYYPRKRITMMLTVDFQDTHQISSRRARRQALRLEGLGRAASKIHPSAPSPGSLSPVSPGGGMLPDAGSRTRTPISPVAGPLIFKGTVAVMPAPSSKCLSGEGMATVPRIDDLDGSISPRENPSKPLPRIAPKPAFQEQDKKSEENQAEAPKTPGRGGGSCWRFQRKPRKDQTGDGHHTQRAKASPYRTLQPLSLGFSISEDDTLFRNTVSKFLSGQRRVLRSMLSSGHRPPADSTQEPESITAVTLLSAPSESELGKHHGKLVPVTIDVAMSEDDSSLSLMTRQAPQFTDSALSFQSHADYESLVPESDLPRVRLPEAPLLPREHKNAFERTKMSLKVAKKTTKAWNHTGRWVYVAASWILLVAWLVVIPLVVAAMYTPPELLYTLIIITVLWIGFEW